MQTAPFLKILFFGGTTLANVNYRNNTTVKKSSNLNIGMVIFGIIFLYLIVCVFMFLTTKHVAGYQVKTGSLFVNNIYTGLALREETIINSNYSGYLNYYVNEGSRIGAYKMVCTVDEGGRLQDIMHEQSMGENSLSEESLNDLRDDIMDFTNDFDPHNFSTTYDFKYAIEGNVLKLANSNILENLEKLNRTGDSGLINVCTAPDSGIVVYSYDGYEDFNPNDITSDILAKKDYEKTQLIANELISSGEPIYKLITDETWSLIIETDAERADYLLEEEYVKVKFLKDQTVSWAEVKLITNSDGKHFIQLIFNNSMIAFCSERFVKIELLIEEEEGLKVPNSAIVQKEFLIVPENYVNKSGENGESGVLKKVYDEDGNQIDKFIPVTIYSKEDSNYYIDSPDLKIGDTLQLTDSNSTIEIKEKGSLVGVYNKNKGYADFKQIQILYQNEEYSIIKSNTEYGLIEYDYIVLEAESVDDDEFLN